MRTLARRLVVCVSMIAAGYVAVSNGIEDDATDTTSAMDEDRLGGVLIDAGRLNWCDAPEARVFLLSMDARTLFNPL